MSFEILETDYQLNQLENIDSKLLALLHDNTEIALISDDFEDIKTIEFTKCGLGIDELFSKDYLGYFKLYTENGSAYNFLGFGFFNHNKFSYIDVVIKNNDLNLAQGDYLIILFEDGHKLKHVFQKPRTGNRYHSSNIIPLDFEILKFFLTKSIEKVKVVSIRKNLYSVYCLNEKSNEDQRNFRFKYITKNEGQILLKYMAFRFIEFNIKNKI